MKALVVYFSKYGNTRRLAEEIAATMLRAGEARTVSSDLLAASDLRDVDLVVMGSPTHFQNLPKAVRPALEALPKRALDGKWVAAFDTSVETWGPLMRLTAAHRLMGKLCKLGGKKAARPETFLVGKSAERPDGETDLLCEGEIERARAWADSLLETLLADGRS